MNTESTQIKEYRGFGIKPKRDFGAHAFSIKGETVREGFVVVRDGCNAMPGATWFRNVIDAKEGIDALILSGGDAKLFWLIMGNSGGTSVSHNGTGHVKVAPCDDSVKFRDGVIVYGSNDQVYTPTQALAFAAAMRKAALYALGDL